MDHHVFPRTEWKDPSRMHCDHVLLAFLELVTRLCRLFSFKHNNGQQVAIDCNIDL